MVIVEDGRDDVDDQLAGLSLLELMLSWLFLDADLCLI